MGMKSRKKPAEEAAPTPASSVFDWNQLAPKPAALKPMQFPGVDVLYMNSLPEAIAIEDIICRSCNAVITSKGEIASGSGKTTTYLRNGEVEYVCKTCYAPKKRKSQFSLKRKAIRPIRHIDR